MPTANVNILAVIVAAVATFVLGAVWYSPVLFAKQWMQAHGYTPEQLEAMKRRGVARAYAVSALCYLVMAYALALLASYTQATSFVQGLWLTPLLVPCPAQPSMLQPRTSLLPSVPTAPDIHTATIPTSGLDHIGNP